MASFKVTNKKNASPFQVKRYIFFVGVDGFEPPTLCL